MRINTMAKTKLLRDPHSRYYLLAGLVAVIVGYVLIFTFRLGKILLQLAVRYWWASVIIVLVVIFLKGRRKRRKKKDV